MCGPSGIRAALGSTRRASLHYHPSPPPRTRPCLRPRPQKRFLRRVPPVCARRWVLTCVCVCVLSASALHYACDGNHTEVAELLLRAGASPNTPDANGRTPLHRGPFSPFSRCQRPCSLVSAHTLSSLSLHPHIRACAHMAVCCARRPSVVRWRGLGDGDRGRGGEWQGGAGEDAAGAWRRHHGPR